jgi:hypothetical protein
MLLLLLLLLLLSACLPMQTMPGPSLPAAQERSSYTPELQPLPREADLAALPASQRPERRAYFALPLGWRYQVCDAQPLSSCYEDIHRKRRCKQ